jgi:hypothetical protein
VPQYDSTNAFNSALQEVDFLLVQSAAHEASVDAYSALNKAIILLLAGKFEAFCEQIVEEFCYGVSEKRLPCERIPVCMRLNATRLLLGSEIMQSLERQDNAKAGQALQSIALLWHEGAVPLNVKLDTRFAYGKHGEKELRRLFNRIGIQDIFELCKVADEQESYEQNATPPLSSVAADINALTGYRNYIIHNDGSPSITHIQLTRYRKRIFAFAEAIDAQISQTDDAIL